MARGRKTEPAASSSLPSGGPLNDASGGAGGYPAPSQLGPLTRAKWDEMIPQLSARPGGLTAGDLDALAQYCSAFVNWRRASAELETAELLVSGKNHIQYMNPLFNVVSSLEASVVKNAARLGLDTAARVRAKIKDPVKKSSAFEEFAKRGRSRAMPDDAGDDGE